MTQPNAHDYGPKSVPVHMCPATNKLPAVHATGMEHIVTVQCFRREGHEGLHFDVVQGDWADGDTERRPYSARNHLLRRLSYAPGPGGMAEDEKLLDAYAHELAQKLRADTRAGYRPNTTRYQHYMEAADHFDPEVQR